MSKLVPFPGFRAFRTEENYLFFGREGLTNEIISRLRKHKFVAVTGVSGSGKSSLVKAGLVPDLHRGLFGEAGIKWVDIQFSPKDAPIENLITSLSQGFPVKKGADIPFIEKSTIASRNEGIIDYYELAETGNNLLIVVDQFEELFRFEKISKDSREEAMFFVELLKQATISKYPIYVVLTMRSDFLGNCAGFPGLLELINESQYLVPRLKRNELQKAIEEPAKIGGATFSHSLISSILNDVVESPDQLPQLQHALRLTWLKYSEDISSNQVISQAHYEAVGGMAGSLGSHAEKLYMSLNDKQKVIIKSVLKTITELGPERKAIRKPISLAGIQEITLFEQKDLKEVIDIFRKEGANFLQPFEYDVKELDEKSTIDISHESLINSWGTLKIWVDSEAKLVNKLRILYAKIEMKGDGMDTLLYGLDLDLGITLINKKKFNYYWVKHVMPVNGFKEEDYQQRVEKIRKYVNDSLVKDKERREREKNDARGKEVRKGYLIAGILVLVTLTVVVFALIILFVKTSKKIDDTNEAYNKAKSDKEAAKKEKEYAEREAYIADSIRAQSEKEKVEANNRNAKTTIRLSEVIANNLQTKIRLKMSLDSALLKESAATQNIKLNIKKAESIKHDYKIYKCLNNARTNLIRENADKAFRYAEFVLKKLDTTNKEAEDLIKHAFRSNAMGEIRNDIYFSYPLIIVADSTNQKIKVVNLETDTVQAYNYVHGFLIVFPHAINKMLFSSSSKSLIVYNLKTQNILQTIPVDTVVRPSYTPDTSYIFFRDRKKISFYDIKNSQFVKLEFDVSLSYYTYYTAPFYLNNQLYLMNYGKLTKYNLKKNQSAKIKSYDYNLSKLNKNTVSIYFYPSRVKPYKLHNIYPGDNFSVKKFLYWVNTKQIFGKIPELSQEEIDEIQATGE